VKKDHGELKLSASGNHFFCLFVEQVLKQEERDNPRPIPFQVQQYAMNINCIRNLLHCHDII
jgi:hypothetical protein